MIGGFDKRFFALASKEKSIMFTAEAAATSFMRAEETDVLMRQFFAHEFHLIGRRITDIKSRMIFIPSGCSWYFGITAEKVDHTHGFTQFLFQREIAVEIYRTLSGPPVITTNHNRGTSRIRIYLFQRPRHERYLEHPKKQIILSLTIAMYGYLSAAEGATNR